MHTVNLCKLPAELSISTSSGAKLVVEPASSSLWAWNHRPASSSWILCGHSVSTDATNGTATPAQPDPQTVHLNAAQSQQQRKEMSLPGAGLRSSQTTDPPPTQPQRREKPLPEAGSPTMGTASPPQIPQQREEIPLPRAQLSPMGATDSSRIQSQRKEMPLPGAGMSAPPITEIPCPATAPPGELPPAAPLCTATPHTASCARLLQTADPPPPTKKKRLASFAATIRGLPRTSFSALMTLYQPL